MTYTRLGFLVALALLTACTNVTFTRDGRPCENGSCPAGWVCHPEEELCVPPITLGCADDGVCPDATSAGDACSTPGSFIPCHGNTLACDDGCRTCTDGVWSACSNTNVDCILGTPSNCAACGDDCSATIENATPTCDATRSCSYDSCDGTAVDFDQDSSNGCECIPSSEVCNGVDDDCDGVADEGFDTGAGCGTGACSAGVLECGGGGTRCSTMPGGSSDQSQSEVCDGTDNDCDGAPDDGFECIAGAVRGCDVGEGPNSGVQTCDPTSCSWSTCSAPWLKRLRVGFDNTAQSEALGDFPVLIGLDSSVIDYADTRSGGADLRFFDADMAPLAHEIERWDTSGTSLVWVRVPSIDAASSSDFIWLYYDQAGAPGYATPAAVWTNGYAGVWHLDDGAAGTGTAGAYADASPNGNAGSDGVSSIGKTGVVGPGQGFTSGDAVTVSSSATLNPTDALTIELWAQRPASTFSYARRISLDAPTPEAGFQVDITLGTATFDYTHAKANGDDLRFYDDAGTSLPYWVEAWNASGASTVWVKVPVSGTSGFTMVYGNSAATAQSSAATTLETNGLWRTTWNFNHNHPNNVGEMNTLFGVSYGSRSGWGSTSSVNCNGTACNPHGGQDNYLALLEGWFNAPSSNCYLFAVDGDDAVDLRLDTGSSWQSGGTLVASWYGPHGFANSFDAHVGSTTLTAGLHRFAYRMEDTTGGDGYAAAVVAAAACPANGATLIASGSFYYRKRNATQPVTSLGIEEVVGVGLVKRGQYTLAVGERGIAGGVDTSRRQLPSSAGWHDLALTYDRANVRLYVDGAASGSPLAGTAAIPTSANGLVLGRTVSVPVSFTARLDEVRVSSVVRSAAWLAAQHLVMTDAFVSFGAPEPAP